MTTSRADFPRPALAIRRPSRVGSDPRALHRVPQRTDAQYKMRVTSLQSAAIRRRLAMIAFVLSGLGIASFWVLISPDNPVTQYFSAPVSVRDAKIIVGPYPREADFALLKRNGVTTIVSLLDPKLPFERVLLDRERTLAIQYGMTLLDFPMGSLFNHQ